MVNLRNPFKRQDSVDAVNTDIPQLVNQHDYTEEGAPDVKSPIDEKDEKDGFQTSEVQPTYEGHNPWEEAGAENMLANGKERPIEVSCHRVVAIPSLAGA